jgi:hypothetical protein
MSDMEERQGRVILCLVCVGFRSIYVLETNVEYQCFLFLHASVQ